MNTLLDEPLFYILFFYGLSFLLMAFLVYRSAKRAAPIPLATSLLLIGLFGLTHGLTEMVDWVGFIWTRTSGSPPAVLVYTSKVLLISSFLILLQFGLQGLLPGPAEKWWFHALPVALGVAFVAVMWMSDVTNIDRIGQLGRFAFGASGALLATISLFRLAVTVKELDDGHLVPALRVAGVAFGVYTVVGGLIVMPLWGLPIQFFRGTCAIAIAVSITIVARSLAAYKLRGEV